MLELDALVIGAGPAGLAAALYLKRGNLSFLLLDKMGPGGKLNEIHEIANMPGFIPLKGPELAKELYSSVSRLDVGVSYGEVVSVEREGDFFFVRTDVDEYRARALIVATGFVYEALIPGERELRGHGVSYCATCDGPLYRGKDVLVYGEGSRVEEEVAYLSGLANEVTALSRQAPIEGKHSPNVHVYGEGEVLSLSPNGGGKIKATVSIHGTKKELLYDAVFPFYGERSALAFLSSLAPRSDGRFLEVDGGMMSSIPGLFAAGDIVKKGLRQVVTALSDGAVAATSLIAYVRRAKRNG